MLVARNWGDFGVDGVVRLYEVTCERDVARIRVSREPSLQQAYVGRMEEQPAIVACSHRYQQLPSNRRLRSIDIDGSRCRFFFERNDMAP